MHNQYDPTISVMKGIAIIGVVAGHCALSRGMELWVNQWHLATFFFVAGYCFKEQNVQKPLIFIWRRIKSLYFPFVAFGLLFLLTHNLFVRYGISGDTEYTWAVALKEVADILVRLTSNEPLMGAMWFCTTLLSASCIMLATSKMAQFIVQNHYGVGGGVKY